jgi:hypothetical protein
MRREDNAYVKLTNDSIGIHREGEESKKLHSGAAEAAPAFRTEDSHDEDKEQGSGMQLMNLEL